MSYISNKFIRNILQEPVKWGPIGQIVYLRTYSRWLNEEQRRERWDETVRRVVDYSVDLDPTMDRGEKIVEAERLFNTIYKMRAFPSGRTMWVGGTEHSATNGQSMFNCAYTDVTSVVTLHDIVVLLMNGVGVGVGVRSDEVAQFKAQGELNLSSSVVIKDYEYVGTPGTGGDQFIHNGAKHFAVHDSREGWAEFVRDFVYTYLFGEEELIYVNVDHIRPEGAPLKTFGGRASGPQALIDFVNGFIQAVSDNDGINDIVLLDTVNLLGRMCVAGGSRRCYPSGTVVKTTDGPIEIQNIKVGMKISTPKGEKRVTNVFNQGVQKTIAVNHAFGSFHCTPNHRVAVFTDINEWEFKEAQHLTTEDRLVWDFEPIPGTPQRLPALEAMRTFDSSYVRNTGRATKPARYPDHICSINGCDRGSATLNGPHGALCNAHYLRLKKYGDALKFRGWGRDVNLPEHTDTDLAWLVGYIHGNGHVMKVSDSKGRLSVSCPTNRLEIIEKVTNILSKLCPDSKITVGKGDGNWVNIMVSNARLVSWLHEYVKRPSEEITIPSFITMAEPEIRAAYLAGVFDSDGNIYKHNFVAVDTIYEGFAAGIAKLYMTLGIGASIKRRERKEEGWSDISRVRIVSSEFKDAAYAAMKPYASTKLQDTILNCKGANTLTFKPKQSMSAGVPSGRAKSNYGNMSPRAVLDYTDISLIAYPVPVVDITDGITAQTWDIEVEDIHQFTAEGFVTHNSALIMLGDATSSEFTNSKTGDYYIKHPWRGQANNSVVFYEKPSIETIKSYFPAILEYGEPGFINGQAALKVRHDWKGLNPCFTGDMRLLTEDGWVTFKEAAEHGLALKIKQDSRVTYEGEGEEKPEHWKIDANNTDGLITTQASHVFLTKKDADIIRVEFENGSVLRLTPDHLVATTVGMVEAQNLNDSHEVLAIEEDNDNKTFITTISSVISITLDGKEDVYCLHENTRRTLIVEKICARRCAEILLPDSGFCVSGDTPLITRNGLVKISDAVGAETDIWNGHRWSTVKPFFTGGDKDLYRVTFNDGSYLDVTDYHRFSTETKNRQYGRWHNSFVEKTTLQMIDDLEKGKIIRMQPFAIEWEDGIDIDETYAYTVGMYAADDTCDPDGGSRTIDLYGAKMALPVMGKKTAPVRRKGYSVDQCSIIGLPFTKQESLEYKKSIDMVFTWSKKAALAYLAGLIDGDGSTTPGGGIRVYVSGREKAAKLQLLVRKLGMRSSLNLMSQKGSETNYGARSEDVYYLQITECGSIPCHRVDTSRGHAPTGKGANQIVKSIVKLEGKHNTYCFTESEFGMGVFGNTLTYQCNLTTVNFKYFAENQDEMHLFEETVRAIVRHNLRITNTTINGVNPKWEATQKRDRLLGVSFTGYGDAVDILGPEKPLQMLERMKELVHQTANEYADKMGIPRPLLSTTVKPEGSITLLYGASSGIHDVYAPYYIRRVRMGRTDALSITLSKLGVPVEDDKFTPGLVVFSFPIKSAAVKSAGSKSAIEQLERYKDIMQTYVDHNASNTIYISKDEVEEVSQWVYDNWDTYIAVSFLPKMDSKYEQAPMEEIDEEAYNKLAAQMPDLSDLHARLTEIEYEMSAGDELEGCDTNSCPTR